MSTETVYRGVPLGDHPAADRSAAQSLRPATSDPLRSQDVPQPSTQADRTADEEAIRALFGWLLDAWARGDGQRYGALFTEDAEYVAFDGSRTVGSQAIADAHQQLFDTWLKGTRLVGQIESVRFLGPDVAVVVATGGTIFPGQQDNRGRRPSIQTLVAVRREGGWLFTAFHNTRIVHRSKLGWMLYGIFSPTFER